MVFEHTDTGSFYFIPDELFRKEDVKLEGNVLFLGSYIDIQFNSAEGAETAFYLFESNERKGYHAQHLVLQEHPDLSWEIH